MSTSGPSIAVKFLADTGGLTSGVDKASSDATSSMEGFAKKAALAVGGAFAVEKVVEFGKSAVEAASADAEAQALLAGALRNTTGATDAQIASAENFISSLSQTAAIADDDLRPALATLARGFGDTEKAQAALSVATDVSAGTGKSLEAVTQAMMKAAQGNTGALKKMGVEVKNADGSAMSLDQVMASMSQTFSGQAATAADSTAGKMRAAKIAMGEMSEQIGTALLPAIGALATFLTGTLLPALSSAFGWIMDNQTVVIAALIGVGAVVLPLFAAWAISAGIAAAATIAAAAPFIAIGVAVAAVAYVVINNWDTIKAVTQATWDAILGAVEFVWDWITGNWPLLLAVITGPFGMAVWLIANYWDQIKGAAVAVWEWLQSTWSSVTSFIVDPISSAVDSVLRLFQSISDKASEVVDWVKDKFGSVGSLVSGALDAINPFAAAASVTATVAFGGVPMLASGGVLTKPTLMVGGEAGREIVAPDDLLRQIVREESGAASSYTLVMQPRTADQADILYGFQRLELMAGVR